MGIVTQHGDYIVQHTGEMRDPSISDINLIHRLMKNDASGGAGWRKPASIARTPLLSKHFHTWNPTRIWGRS